VVSIADIPSGTGLGSSSSFSVALLNALYAHQRVFAPKEQLAQEACMLEIERLGEPIGKQDQYAAAYGGMNLIEFEPHGDVTVHRHRDGARK
jgi:D-glycero-alpha-D-manno-heptose-7-phosphate kinase